MNKLTDEQIEKAREQVKTYLIERRDILKGFEQDKGERLIEYAKAGLAQCDVNLQTGKISARMTDQQLKHLIETAATDYTAWSLLRDCATANPDDERLKPFILRLISGEQPPKKKRGRKPETMRNFFIVIAIQHLLIAGLNPPSVGEFTRKEYNAAYVLSDILEQIGGLVVLSPDQIRDIWREREEILAQAIPAATVLKT